MVTTLKKTNKKGFTLVELVIVIAILAILAAIAIPTVTNVIGTANTNVDAANAQTVEIAIKSTSAELQAGTWDGKFTSTDTALTAASITVADALKHQGIPALPTTRTGNVYRCINGKVSVSSAVTAGVTVVATSVVATVLANTASGT